MIPTDQALFEDVVDILHELQGVFQSALARYSDPQYKGDDALKRVIDEYGRNLVERFHVTQLLLSAILEKRAQLPVPAASLRNLVMEKLGDIMENAHRVREKFCSFEQLSSPSASLVLQDSSAPIQQDPPTSTLAAFRASDLRYAQQIFRETIQRLDDAQRIFRIAYHTVGDVSPSESAPMTSSVNAKLSVGCVDEEEKSQYPLQNVVNNAPEARGDVMMPLLAVAEGGPGGKVGLSNNEACRGLAEPLKMDADTLHSGAPHPAPIGIPPRSPTAFATLSQSISSSPKLTEPSAGSSASLSFPENQITQHARHFPGKAWGELIEFDRPRVVEALVKDIMDLFNYGELELVVLPSDIDNVTLSCVDDLLHVSFKLANSPTLSNMDVDLRIYLYAFPNMRDLYNEYTAALQAKRRGTLPPQRALSNEWHAVREDPYTNFESIPEPKNSSFSGDGGNSESSINGSDMMTPMLRRSTTALPERQRSEEPAFSSSLESKSPCDTLKTFGSAEKSFIRSVDTAEQKGKMKGPHEGGSGESQGYSIMASFMNSPEPVQKFDREPTKMDIAPSVNRELVDFEGTNYTSSLYDELRQPPEPSSGMSEPFDISMAPIHSKPSSFIRILPRNDNRSNSSPTPHAEDLKFRRDIDFGSSQGTPVSDSRLKCLPCNGTTKGKERVIQIEKEGLVDKDTILSSAANTSSSHVSLNKTNITRNNKIAPTKKHSLGLEQKRQKPLPTKSAVERMPTCYRSERLIFTGNHDDSKSERCESLYAMPSLPRDWQVLTQPCVINKPSPARPHAERTFVKESSFVAPAKSTALTKPHTVRPRKVPNSFAQTPPPNDSLVHPNWIATPGKTPSSFLPTSAIRVGRAGNERSTSRSPPPCLSPPLREHRGRSPRTRLTGGDPRSGSPPLSTERPTALAAPPAPPLTHKPPAAGDRRGPGHLPELGLGLDPLCLRVGHARGLAAAADLHPGDLLRTVDGKPIQSLRQFQDYLSAPARSRVFLTVQTRRGDIVMRRLMLPEQVESRVVDAVGPLADVREGARSGTSPGPARGNPHRQGPLPSSRRRRPAIANRASDEGGRAGSGGSEPRAEEEPPQPTPFHDQAVPPRGSTGRSRNGGHSAVSSRGRPPRRSRAVFRSLTGLQLSPIAPRLARLPSTMTLDLWLNARARGTRGMRGGLPGNPDIFADLPHSDPAEVERPHQDARACRDCTVR